jgi:PhnB protein
MDGGLRFKAWASVALTVQPATWNNQALVPVYVVKGADEFIAFCKEALGAEEILRMPGPGGSVMHGELKVEETIVWVTDSIKEPPTSAAAAVKVSNCDAVFDKALSLGATIVFPPSTPSWGGRWARVVDKWGNGWTFMTPP